MLTVRFQGAEYLFTGDTLADGGALTTPAAYENGVASYAHVCLDGTVKRYRQVIGTVADVEVVGPADSPDMTVGGVVNLLTGETWDRPAG